MDKLSIVFINSKTRDIFKPDDIALITDLSTEDRLKEFIRYSDAKNYYTDMIDRGIIEITKYGVAFCGKNVEIAL